MGEPKGNLFVPLGTRSDGTIRTFEVDNNDRLKVTLDGLNTQIVVLGYDYVSQYRFIRVDTNGNVVIVAPENTPLNPTSFIVNYTNTTLPAGTNVINLFTVPANQRYIIEAFNVFYNGTVATVQLFPFINDGAATCYIDNIITPISGKYYTYYPKILVEAGWTIGCTILNATLNDDFLASVFMSRVK